MNNNKTIYKFSLLMIAYLIFRSKCSSRNFLKRPA